MQVNKKSLFKAVKVKFRDFWQMIKVKEAFFSDQSLLIMVVRPCPKTTLFAHYNIAKFLHKIRFSDFFNCFFQGLEEKIKVTNVFCYYKIFVPYEYVSNGRGGTCIAWNMLELWLTIIHCLKADLLESWDHVMHAWYFKMQLYHSYDIVLSWSQEMGRQCPPWLTDTCSI